MGEASRRHSHSVPTVCRQVLAILRNSSSSMMIGLIVNHAEANDVVAISDCFVDGRWARPFSPRRSVAPARFTRSGQYS